MLRFFIGLLTFSGLTLPATAQSAAPGRPAPRVSYSLQAGTWLTSGYGGASYLSPTASYRLTSRFTAFGGLTYLRQFPGAALSASEGRVLAQPGLNRLLVQAGGQYAVSPRLALTGTAWKDLTPSAPGLRVNPYAGFSSPGSGFSMRADYLISEHFSVSGGIRYSSGYSAPGYVNPNTTFFGTPAFQDHTLPVR
ncbi:porin family protein [Hymenobacter sp. BT175]|uniref:porin family protein n=1 Tax=Hymenobacter translucens TaxID=2886507 RepID=UPI001D0ED448|nr:porin family protein [Hymenobacter translucens]MCC2548138.1 porin family protein [Hymenobacter translucens]